jgi:16S rRNA (cytosine967-C5)-methyltransferase
MRSVRSLALGILIRVERDRAHAAPLLDARGISLPPRDRDLLRALVKGVLRNAIRLDHVVARHLDRPVEMLDIPVRAALRLGAAQLLLLDRVPPHAAVSETVAAVKEIAPRGAGLVNAVLRKVAANEERPGVVRLPDADPLDRLVVETSHPSWLVRRWAERFGCEAAAGVLAADNADSPVDLLADPLVGSREEVRAILARDGVRTTPSDWAPLALTVEEGDAIGHPLVRSGRLAVVDAAAQALVELVPASAVVVDLTASPGGKTRTLLARGKARRVIALERQGARVLRLARNLSDGLRRGEVLVVRADAARPPLPRGRFESILLDAPCSGTGTLRKNPEIRSRLRREDFGPLASLQRELLRSALDLLSPGGTVTWMTCSLEPEENEDVVDAILAERTDAIRLPAKEMPLPAALIPWSRPDGLVRVLPGPENDGFSALTVKRIRQ